MVQLTPSPEYHDLSAPLWCALFAAFLYLPRELPALPVCPMNGWAVMFRKLVPVFLHRSYLNFLPVFSVCCMLQAKPRSLFIVEDMQYHSSFSSGDWLGTGTSSPVCSKHQGWQSSGSVWKMPSGIWCDSWGLLCKARNWTQWSWSVPSNSG